MGKCLTKWAQLLRSAISKMVEGACERRSPTFKHAALHHLSLCYLHLYWAFSTESCNAALSLGMCHKRLHMVQRDKSYARLCLFCVDMPEGEFIAPGEIVR